MRNAFIESSVTRGGSSSSELGGGGGGGARFSSYIYMYVCGARALCNLPGTELLSARTYIEVERFETLQVHAAAAKHIPLS